MMCRLLKKLLITVSSSLLCVFSLFAESTVSYEIDVTIADDGKSFSALQTVVFVPEFNTDHILFHVYWNGLKKESELIKGAPRQFQDTVRALNYPGVMLDSLAVNGDSVSAEQHTDPSVYRIIAPGGFSAKKKYIITMKYSARVPQRVLRYGYHESDGITWFSQWFPKIGVLRAENTWLCEPARYYTEFFSDYSDYTLRVSIPSQLSVVANLKTISTLAENERILYAFAGTRIHDCTFGFSSSFYISKNSWNSVPIRYVRSRAPSAAQTEFVMTRARFALEHLSSWIGHYPYDELTIVELDSFGIDAGGMEYPSLIQVTSRMSLMGRAIDHEIAHQWFYGVIGFNETDEPWLDEGWTSYYEFRLDRLRGSRVIGPIKYSNFDLAYIAYSKSKMKNDSSIQTRYDEASRFHGYVKAPVVISMLASLISENSMDEIVREMVRLYSYSHPDTTTILQFLSSKLDTPVYDAFERALTGEAFNYSIVKENESLRVHKNNFQLPEMSLRVQEKGKGNDQDEGVPQRLFSVPVHTTRIAAVHVVDGNPSDSYYYSPSVVPVFASIGMLAVCAVLLRLLSRKIKSDIRRDYTVFLSWTCFFMIPVVTIYSSMMGLVTSVQAITLPFNGFVMPLTNIKTWIVPVFAGIAISIIASIIRSTVYSIRIYAEPDATYSIVQIFFLDCAFYLIIPLYTAVVVAIGHFNIFLFSMFVLLLAMAEPLKILLLMPSKKAIIAMNFKSLVMQSLLVNFFTLCAVLLLLVVSTQAMMTSMWFFILGMFVFSSLEFVYRSMFVAMIRRLPASTT